MVDAAGCKSCKGGATVTQLISFIAIALGLGASLASLALRKRVEGGSDAMVKAKQALSSLQAGLLPAEMVARIFDRTDLIYVESQASERHSRAVHVQERKQVVLSWVRRVRPGSGLDLQEFPPRFGPVLCGAEPDDGVLAGHSDFAMLLLVACRAAAGFRVSGRTLRGAANGAFDSGDRNTEFALFPRSLWHF